MQGLIKKIHYTLDAIWLRLKLDIFFDPVSYKNVQFFFFYFHGKYFSPLLSEVHFQWA
jgi:hypothetical protein